MTSKTFKAILTGFILTALAIGTSPAFGQSIEDLKRGVVKITAQVQGKPRIGTGFVVRLEKDAAYIVTAAHVIEGDSNPDVEFLNARTPPLPARVMWNEGGDRQGLGLLLVKGQIPEGVRMLPLGEAVQVRSSDPVTMIGFPRVAGIPWAVTRGEIVGRKGKTIVFSGAIEEGNSGGPLIKEGHVIGVITEASKEFVAAIPSGIVRYVLEGWGIRFGIELRSRPAKVSPAEIVRAVREKALHHPFDDSEDGFSGSAYGAIKHEFWAVGKEAFLDKATGLMWPASIVTIALADDEESQIEKHVQEFNARKVGGFGDWRLPTFEELGSLIEPLGFRRQDTGMDYLSEVITVTCRQSSLALTADTVLYSTSHQEYLFAYYTDPEKPYGAEKVVGARKVTEVHTDRVFVDFLRGWIRPWKQKIDQGQKGKAYCLLPVRTIKSGEIETMQLDPIGQ